VISPNASNLKAIHHSNGFSLVPHVPNVRLNLLAINVFYQTVLQKTDLQGRPLGKWGQELVFDGYLCGTDLPMMYEEMDPILG